MSRPKSLAIVGCGIISHAHAQAAANHPQRLRLAGCADVVREKASAFAEQYGIPAVYSDFREMIREERPDVVALATWPVLHEEQVLACCELGVPAILCEKSLAMNAASARKMASAAESAGTLLLEGFMWRHHPRTLEAQRLVRRENFGPLRKMRAVFQRNAMADAPGSWKHRPETGGGVVYDFCCYCVNAAGAFFPGMPESVLASWQRTPEGLVTDLNGLLLYPGGQIAIIESGYRHAFLQQLELHGTDSIIRIANCFTPGNQADIEATAHGKSRSFDAVPTEACVQADEQMLHLIDCLETGREPRFSSRESVNNHAILDALLASAASGRAVAPVLP